MAARNLAERARGLALTSVAPATTERRLIRRGEGVLDAVLVIVVVRSGFGRLLHAIPDLPSSYWTIIRPVLP